MFLPMPAGTQTMLALVGFHFIFLDLLAMICFKSKDAAKCRRMAVIQMWLKIQQLIGWPWPNIL